MAATVLDVTARAGVSLTTVHRALSGNGYVRAETHQKVPALPWRCNTGPTSSPRAYATSAPGYSAISSIPSIPILSSLATPVA